MASPKILILDIETAPNTAYVWGLFKEYIPLARLVETGYTLCWSAKWYGEKEVEFDSIYDSRPKTMVKRIHKLLDQADAVVHYNGSKFDIPTLNKEFLTFGLPPPAPYKQIDLLRVARKHFKLPSYKLAYLAKVLGLELGKGDSMPFGLWERCMDKDPEAWADMMKYNINDVELTEAVYEKLLPWITRHINHSVVTGELVCPNCGSHNHQARGFAYTAAGKYRRHQCKDCGKWFRGNTQMAESKEKFVDVGS